MNRHRRPRWTVEEFLDWDNAQAQAHEYVGGMIRTPMVDTRAHATIESNLQKLLARLLAAPARVFEDHERVVTGASASYPDVAVTNDAKGVEARIQPTAVFEILARRTENLDRGHKWIALQTLQSLQYFVLVSQDRFRVEVHRRTAEGFEQAVFTKAEDQIALPALGITLPMRDVYAGTNLAR